MLRVILEIISAIIFLVWGKWFANPNLQPELYGMSIGIGIALIIEFLNFLHNESPFLKLYYACFVKSTTNPSIRLTIAYLYKIEVQGKYLLVKSRNIQNAYQPVGGVYKYFDPEAKVFLNSISVITDNSIPNDDINERDLRVKMTNRKNIKAFLKWFFSNSQREIDPWREFYEELVATGLLSNNNFQYIHYEKVGQHFEPIHFDTFYHIDTFKYVDIYIPKFLNQNQKNEIRNLRNTISTEYIWATENEIKNNITMDGKIITPHSYKIFHTKKLSL